MRELLTSLSILCTACLVVWLFFASAALRALRGLGAPVSHWLTVFIAPIGCHPAVLSLFYFLQGKYRAEAFQPIPSYVERTRVVGQVVVGTWFVVTPLVSLLWFTRVL